MSEELPDLSAVNGTTRLSTRLIVLLVSWGLFLIGHYLLRDLLTTALPDPAALPSGARTAVRHVFYFTLVDGVVAAGAIALWVRLGFFPRRDWTPTRGIPGALLLGCLTGLVLSALIGAAWHLAGLRFGVHPDPWLMGGNLASNLYEELTHRGLLLGALLFATRRPRLSLLISSVFFGATHQGYPLWMQAMVAFAGLTFGWVWLKTRNILAPWVAHCVADAILDSFLVT
ncbi:MAG: CPBP family intramembrane glutamic endopeptidase [Pseudomonadota bacterium]